METFSALLAICAGNSPVHGEFPAQRPVTRSFDVFFDLRPNKRLSKQSWGWWSETPSSSLWRHRNGLKVKTMTSTAVNVTWHRTSDKRLSEPMMTQSSYAHASQYTAKDPHTNNIWDCAVTTRPSIARYCKQWLRGRPALIRDTRSFVRAVRFCRI